MSISQLKDAAHTPDWTSTLIRMLRGKRTQTDFGKLIGAPKNTVWRWEAGLTAPHPIYVARLNELAEAEHFLVDWQLVGSVIEVANNLDSGSRQIAGSFRSSILSEGAPRTKLVNSRRKATR